MKRRSFFRAFMIAVGLSASVMIVLSQYLPKLPESFKEESKTEQTAEPSAEITHFSTPTDLAPSTNAVQLNEGNRSLLETILPEKNEEHISTYCSDIFTGYLNVLFRVIISPNAP